MTSHRFSWHSCVLVLIFITTGSAKFQLAANENNLELNVLNSGLSWSPWIHSFIHSSASSFNVCDGVGIWALVKPLPVMAGPIFEFWFKSWLLCFPSCSLVTYLGRQWMMVQLLVGRPRWSFSSWFQPGPAVAIATIWEVDQKGKIYLPFLHSAFQINKIPFFKKISDLVLFFLFKRQGCQK